MSETQPAYNPDAFNMREPLTFEQLPPHAQRVVAEEQELAKNIEKLSAFVNSDRMFGIGLQHQVLLYQQLGAMAKYDLILLNRINLFQRGIM